MYLKNGQKVSSFMGAVHYYHSVLENDHADLANASQIGIGSLNIYHSKVHNDISRVYGLTACTPGSALLIVSLK